MTAAPVKTDFPDSSQSPWTNPDNGLTYEWNGWGWDLVIEEVPETDKEPPSGSAFTFTFAVCLSSDFDSANGQILLGLGGVTDDFSLPLQTLQSFQWTEKDINGFTTPEWRDDWDVHIYAEDASAQERGGVTLGWRSASSNGRSTAGICEDNVNSSITILEEGALVQLVFTPKGVEPEGRLSPLRYRYKAVAYDDFTDRDGTIGIGIGAEDGSDGLTHEVLIALSAINWPEADLAGNVAPGFSDEHEILICAADKDTGKEGTYRVLLKEGGQRGHRQGFVKTDTWYTDFNSPKIKLGSDIELIFIPVAKAALEDNRVQINEGVPGEPWEQGDLYFDVKEDELTLYIYVGDDWAPAAPPVSLDGIYSDIYSLQEVANDVKKQLAYQTIEAQKADTKILELEEDVASLDKRIEEIEIPEVENLDSLKKRIHDLETKLLWYEKYEKAPAVVAWRWQGKAASTQSTQMRWDDSKFLYVSHTPSVGNCRKLAHDKWNEKQAHDFGGGLMSFWVYRDQKWYQTMILHIKKYRVNYNGWFQFEYSYRHGEEPNDNEQTYVSMSGMF